ncbi:MAG: sigma-70 family RNA polymerase sigma factor [Bacilli bacterium]|nr:sigma-70 family RNA polymerase sigma factor [Bacilli bacterium]
MDNLTKRVIEGFYRKEYEPSILVYEHYRKLIYFSLSTLIDNKEDLNDVYLEVFTRLFKNQPEFPEDGVGIASYLVKSAKSIALNMKKENSKYESIHEEPSSLDSLNLMSKYLVPPLNETEGYVVLYRAAFELSFKDISELVNIPETSVRRMYRDGLSKLRRKNRNGKKKD